MNKSELLNWAFEHGFGSFVDWFVFQEMDAALRSSRPSLILLLELFST